MLVMNFHYFNADRRYSGAFHRIGIEVPPYFMVVLACFPRTGGFLPPFSLHFIFIYDECWRSSGSCCLDSVTFSDGAMAC